MKVFVPLIRHCTAPHNILAIVRLRKHASRVSKNYFPHSWLGISQFVVASKKAKHTQDSEKEESFQDVPHRTPFASFKFSVKCITQAWMIPSPTKGVKNGDDGA